MDKTDELLTKKFVDMKYSHQILEIEILTLKDSVENSVSDFLFFFFSIR